MSTIRLHNAKKNDPEVPYRLMTVDEAKQLQYGQRVWFISNQGDARQCKVNGKPKIWKTRPNDCVVPLKYGLYEYAYANFSGGINLTTPLIVLLEA